MDLDGGETPRSEPLGTKASDFNSMQISVCKSEVEIK